MEKRTQAHKQLERDLKDAYTQFFRGIQRKRNEKIAVHIKDKKGAMIDYWKFATDPFIGSDYKKGEGILFIGLDIGRDEYPGKSATFEERRLSIEGHNPHISGTILTALYLNHKNDHDWMRNKWQRAVDKEFRQFYDAAKELESTILSKVALTNFHKFVSVDRRSRSGGKNRIYPKEINNLELEQKKLLLEEIRILLPTMIVFQGREFRKMLDEKYNDATFRQEIDSYYEPHNKPQIYVGAHPAFFAHSGKENAQNLIIEYGLDS